MNRFFIILTAILVSLTVNAAENEPKVLIKTSMGKIHVKLYNETPQHRDNFLKLVQEHKYDSIMFHRVIKMFMIQAGEKYPPVELDSLAMATRDSILNIQIKAPHKKWKVVKNYKYKHAIKKEKKYAKKQIIKRDPNYSEPDYLIPAEIVFPQYFHKRGQLCAARQDDNVNPERKSSALQFYIVTGKFYTEHELDKMEKEQRKTLTPEQRHALMFEGGAPHLDGNYTVFGEVTKGLKVVQKIELTRTDHFDRPLKEVRIKTMKIAKK